MQIRGLTDGPLAAEVLGIDLSEGLDNDAWHACVDALSAHRVLVFRDQHLTPAQFLAFGRRWGHAVPHVLDHLRMRDAPEIMQIGNIGSTAAGEQVHHGADYWHTDQSYDAEPVSATMLYSILVPSHGGNTQFADMVQAFEALPKAMQAQLDSLVVRHAYGAASQGKVARISETQRTRVPSVTHPLVRVHPRSGRRALYAICGTAEHVEGMTTEASQSLLASLRAHALQERFIYRHPYRVGDLALYDTSATLHAATTIPKAAAEHDRRLLWRISVTGGT
jgi:taurine dioxygenase